MTKDGIIIDTYKPFVLTCAHKFIKLSVTYWNISSIGNKLENGKILKLFSKYEIIFSSELKTNLNIHLPGFESSRNSKRYSNHDDICVFIKNHLSTQISMMRFDEDDGEHSTIRRMSSFRHITFHPNHCLTIMI